VATPDIQFHLLTVSVDRPGVSLHDFSGFTSSICQLRPESRGTIQIRSTDPMDKPAIRANYFSTETDRRVTVAGMRLARRIAETAPLAELIESEFIPGPDVQTDEEMVAAARQHATTIFHPVGTCKMGDDPLAVVDDRLRLHGVGGLRVADCSIMPTLVSGNTNAGAIMIGEKCAEMMLEDSGR
jgi:choline dehydrogenase